MLRRILFSVMLALSAGSAAQVHLEGRVFNDSLHTPVARAVIFLPELNAGTVSDELGRFSLFRIPKGDFVMQVTHLGYKPFIREVRLTDTLVRLDVLLQPSSVSYPEIVVHGTQNSAPEQTPNNIEAFSSADMRSEGAMSLSDGVAKMPGVSQLTTGAGISKPVIRGLFGNRIQTVLLGLRFDNQQWQDEHGLGLSDVGVDRVEIIKGPASLLYGSEAMGGVLNVIEEKAPASGTTAADFSTRFFSNTLGVTTDVGVKSQKEKIYWRIRAGMESHADYFDGNNKRVLNSRFGGYYGKASLGFHKKRWYSVNHYLFSMSNFGFLMDPIQLNDPPDERNSRSFDRPHHSVYLNVFSSQNTWYLDHSKLKVNGGVHINNRQEQEGGSKISLDMLLNTYIVNALWIKDIGEKTELSLGTQDYYQTNTNVGSRTIVPDATQFETSFFAYSRHSREKFVAEGGIRYDLRSVETFATGTINTDPFSPGSSVVPFSKLYSSLNGSLGFSLFDGKHWNLKANASTGYRAGNLAELSSNGLHEGTVRYEIGDISLHTEQNLCSDIMLTYDNQWITLNGSTYYNRFFNYIYLAPTNTEYLGFQIFRYLQKDAALSGVEATVDIHPAKIKWLDWKTAYAVVQGKADDGEYLPFVPAAKINSDFKISFPAKKKTEGFFIRPGFTYVFAQTTPGQFETPTDAYELINAFAGITINNKKNSIEMGLSGNNLANKVYYDHLSRFKYFGVYNIGRNVSFNFKMSFH